jgi:diguanylate cyclase (GGDEF)-like protein/PAS domain S-box-containing protein
LPSGNTVSYSVFIDFTGLIVFATMFRTLSTRRPRPVAHLLTGLALACLLPGIFGSALFLLAEYCEERDQQSEEMLELARDIGREVDTHLLQARSVARALSTPRRRAAPGPDLFSSAGADLAAAALGHPVVVYRADGSGMRQVASGGQPVPGGPDLQAIRTVLATRRAVIGPVATDAASGERSIAAHLPVLNDGKADYVLSVAIPAADLSALLAQRHLPQGWLAALLDGRGVIAARNRAADRYTGQPAMDSLRTAIATQETGELDTVTKEGVANFTVFARSPLTGYTTIVGIPRADIIGPLATRLLYLAGAMACMSVLGLLLARAMGRRIAGSIQALIEPAAALGQGMPQAMPAVHLREAADVGAALERAAALLCQRDAALRAQQEELQQFKFFSEHANEMLLLLDEQGRIRYANRRACERLGYGNAELLSMTLFQIDLASCALQLRQVFAQTRLAQMRPFERLYTCKDGSEFPVEITATVLELQGEWLMHVAPRDIAERHQAERAVRWAAAHDSLTGLPNRARALAFLEQALDDLRAGAPGGALLFVDLDRFKPINDQYGHEVGDRVLQAVAQRLYACVDRHALLARVGGDEFVVVLPGLGQDTERPEAVARAILGAMALPIAAGGIEAALSASIGISRFPEHGDTANLLVHAADMAMLQVKHNGRGGFAWYAPHMDAQAQFTLCVERRLQQALEHGGLLLHYQPIVDLASGRTVGVEALLRLDDGLEPAVGPGTFVPIAEGCGLVLPLGGWVKREACRQQVAWQAAGLALTMSVNVSPLQFSRAGFCQRVRELIAATGIDPHQLVIEVTETAIMEDLAEAAAILGEVKALGVRIALDDFGTGYSSLSTLSALPLDKLKIDQSFVRRIETDHASRAVIDAVIALAHSLNLELVAEGIETAAALDYLRARGCQLGQGYYFSRPLPAAVLEDWCGRAPA